MGSVKGDQDKLGMKAYVLAHMARLGLPVPPGFVLGTPQCRLWRQDPGHYKTNLAPLLEEQMHWLQSVTKMGFGDSRNPLLVSVRSGAPISMPGMMDTLLNIGLCDSTVHGLLRMTGNPRLVWDSYRRLIQNFAEVVFGASPLPFVEALEGALVREHLDRFQELDYLSLSEITRIYLRLFGELTGKPFPQNPFEQLELAVQAVFSSWNSPRAVDYRRIYGISDDLCTAVTIQKMVFGNAGGTSGSGVGFTRDPDTGEKRLYFDFLFNCQGEDVVSGRTPSFDTERLSLVLPGTLQELHNICGALEQEFHDAQEFEFTIQDGILYLLQARPAKRTPWATLRIAVDQVAEGVIDQEEALARLAGLPLDGIKRERLLTEGKQPLCQGQPAGIGVASGPIALDVDAARKYSTEGKPAVLVREEMNTDDIAGIVLATGVLTARGNRTSHAAVVARQLGKACVTGCKGLRIDLARRAVVLGDRTVAEGEPITLDSNTGRVFGGEAEIVIDYPTQWLEEIGKWRHSADTRKTVKSARGVHKSSGQ
jgi:pyruvate,orthophosphate dikinase